MLRIRVLDSADQAKSYYVKAAAMEAYYSEGQEFTGYWGGKAAQLLGLNGRVGEEEFCRLCDNLHPLTGSQLTPRMMKNRRVGYEFNFNAPKSVSLAYFYLRDERILQVFRQAEEMTMEEVENVFSTRVRKGDRNRDENRLTRNLVRAGFIHLTARPEDGIPDPHLHSHVVVFNATRDGAEQRWKAGQFGDVKKMADRFQAIFLSHLSTGLAEIGYPIEHYGKWFGLAGISRELVQKFSRRTETINQRAAELGITDPAEKDKLAALTRERKAKHLLIPDLEPFWWDRLTEDDKRALNGLRAPLKRVLSIEPTPAHYTPEDFGYRAEPERRSKGRISRNQATRPVSGLTKEREATDEDRRAVNYATAHLFERKSAVREWELETQAIYSWGYGRATLSGIRKAIADSPFVRREKNGEIFLMTHEVIAEEKRLINLCLSNRLKHEPINGFWKILDPGLNDEQRKGVMLALNSRDLVVGICGPAGTGKSRLMHELIRGAQAGYYKVHLLAPWGVTAHETLKGAGFNDANTIKSLLVSERLQREARGSLLIVDEAGLVSTRLADEFFQLAAKLNARLVLVGDTSQHHPVDRGQVVDLLRKYAQMPVAELTDIKRQKDPAYKAFVDEYLSGDPRKAITSLWSMESLTEQPVKQLAQTMARDYLKVLRDKKTICVSAPTHAECDYATAAIRSAMKQERMLGDGVEWDILRNLAWTDAEKRDWERYKPGQVVKFNGHVKGFALGEQVEIIDAHEGSVRVRVNDGRFKFGIKALPLSKPESFHVYERNTVEICPGDCLHITGNGRSADGHPLRNGVIRYVDYIGHDGCLVLNDGRRIPKSFPHLHYGYVLTSHAAQGRTVDVAFCFQTAAFSSGMLDRTSFGVAATRGREILKNYTDSFEWLKDAVSNEIERPMATEILTMDEQQIEPDNGVARQGVATALGKTKRSPAIERHQVEKELEEEMELEI